MKKNYFPPQCQRVAFKCSTMLSSSDKSLKDTPKKDYEDGGNWMGDSDFSPIVSGDPGL